MRSQSESSELVIEDKGIIIYSRYHRRDKTCDRRNNIAIITSLFMVFLLITAISIIPDDTYSNSSNNVSEDTDKCPVELEKTPCVKHSTRGVYEGWTKNEIDTSLDGGSYVFVADIDGLNGNDVVATGITGDVVVWYEAPVDPKDAWTRYTIDNSLVGAIIVYVADIDDDTNPDVVASGSTDDDIVWYEAPDDPTGTWTKHDIDTNFDGAWGVHVADIDEDMNPDVVATGYAAGDVVWYEAPDDPTGIWIKHNIDTNLDGAIGVYVADIDGVNKSDVVVAGYNAWEVVWYESPFDPTGTWIKHTIDANLEEAHDVHVADIDGINGVDVVATGFNADDVVWYEAPSDPTGIWTKHNIDINLNRASYVYVGDIDGENVTDVAATSAGSHDVVWYESPADPIDTWTKHTIDDDLQGARGISIADIDGINRSDIVAVGFNVWDVVWYEASGNQSIPETPADLMAWINGDDITLGWNMSNLSNVDYYNIYRSNQGNGPYILWSNTTNEPDPLATMWNDTNAAIDSNNYFYMVTAVNKTIGESVTSNIAGKYLLPLGEGWNMISIPFIQKNSSLETVFSSVNGNYDIIIWYDATKDNWISSENGLNNIDPTMSVWIHMKTNSNLKVAGRVPSSINIKLNASGSGWNFVGYPSITNKTIESALGLLWTESKIDAVQHFNCLDINDPWKHKKSGKPFGNDLEYMRTGEGYWILVTQDCEWIIIN